MKYVVVQVLTEDLPRATLTLAELGGFNPSRREEYSKAMPLVPGEEYRELFRQAESRLEKILNQIPLGQSDEIGEVREVGQAELEEINRWLGRLWERCSAIEQTEHDLEEEERMIAQLDEALDNFAHLDIDLGQLQREKIFLDTRIGILPKGNLEQLRGALELAGYLLYTYMQHEENSHVIVVGPKAEAEGELGEILDTAGFRHLPIPPELHDEPEAVRKELEERRQRIVTHRQTIRSELEHCAAEVSDRLREVHRQLLLARPYAEVDQAVHSSGTLAVLTGWMPERELPRARQALAKTLTFPFHLETRDPLPEEEREVPSHSPRGGLLKSFSILVSQYGVPRYGEIDPTPIFAVSFIAMFGMMFGDIGHGLAIVAAALFARKLLKSFTVFAVLAGASATLFGFLYGSIFGYHILHAWWIEPLSDPLYMLSVALVWGVCFLVVISLLAIYNRVARKAYSDAIFETNGVVSLILYLSIMGGFYGVYLGNGFSTGAAITATLCLLALLSYKLIETEAPPAERMMVALIETFETLTGYVSNTLSFLRVAAFSLNHVALAIAVFTLADMMDTTGHWIMVICGNIFILVLEGAIVTIQALRLEYYEGFSRFYSGDGRRFEPLKLGEKV
jgi:V/A-type H+-transporting ATPase subunit I